MEFIKKYKKLIGTSVVLLIVIVSTLVLYYKNGINELNVNDNDIFVEENQEKEDSKSKDKTASIAESQTTNTKSKKITVEIKGEVVKPDVYTLDESSIVKDLIDLAGGVTENADLSNINRAKQLQNHELVYISNKSEINNTQSISKVNPSSSTQNSNGLININSANIDELKKINGIGDSKAKTIIEYREKNGPFNTIEDIKNVGGIGEKMFEKIKEQITI